MSDLVGYITGMVIIYGPLVLVASLLTVTALEKYLTKVSTGRIDLKETSLYKRVYKVFCSEAESKPVLAEARYEWRSDLPTHLKDKVIRRSGYYREVIGYETNYIIGGFGIYLGAHVFILTVVFLLNGLSHESEDYSIYNSLTAIHHFVSWMAPVLGHVSTIGIVLLMMHVVTKLIFNVWDKVDAVNAKLSNHVVDKDAHKGEPEE